jgi:hypothetical protein
MGFVYLASPYSSISKVVMEQRFKQACQAAAELMDLGFFVFSPIAHSHPIADYMDERRRTDCEFWLRQDEAVLAAAREMIILVLEGWRTSKGVTREIEYCQKHNIPIRHYELGRGFV